jgi:hypothetical protein
LVGLGDDCKWKVVILTFIQGVQVQDFLVLQLEVEDLGVGGDSGFRGRLGDGDVALIMKRSVTERGVLK